MIENDRKKFSQILFKLSNIYPKEITESLIDDYWDDLQGYNIESIKEAVKRFRRDSTSGFFPVSGLLLAYLKDINIYKNAQLPAPNPTAEDKLWGHYQCRLSIHLLKRKNKKRWAMADKPRWRYEWYKKHTDMPDYMLEELKKEIYINVP